MAFLRTFLLLLIVVPGMKGQHYWKNIHKKDIPPGMNLREDLVIPSTAQSLLLSYDAFTRYLRTAPLEFTHHKGIMVNIPMPDGTLEPFECFFSPVMEDPSQHEQYGVYTYKARSLNHPGWSLRMDFSTWGFHATVHTSSGQVFIEPMSERAGMYYVSYYINDLAEEMPELFRFKCKVDDSLVDINPKHGSSVEMRSGDWPLMTFRVAISCTGEWGGNPSLGGGTVESSLAKITSSLNTINEVFEREVGIRLLLVPGNKNLIFTNGKIDPFADANMGGSLLGQNTNLINRKIGVNSYDIGHIFTARCNDVGGIAALSSVCSTNKGAGVTCWYTSSLNYVAVQITCHEMGHQFSAPHTFNNCNGNESGSTAYEPGGGSTIMSYSGLCGAQSFVRRADPVYHNNSLTRFYNHVRVSDVGNCGKPIDVQNNRPSVHIPIESGFTIPYLTPFELTGEASDPEDEALSYSWEQYTTGRMISIGMPEKGDGNVPLFRSFPPVQTPTRTFPRLDLILNRSNNIPVSDLTEVLPPYEFNFTFAFTVRDNNPDAGAANWDYLSFIATEKAGPFRILSPNEKENFDAGTYKLVEWAVANTDKEPVNCKFVNIYLFKETDYSHPVLLAENTPNDGGEWVLIPDTSMRAARIKVKAAHSIFFDVNDRPIRITRPDSTPVSLGIFPNSIQACVPQTADLELLSTGAPSTNKIHIVEITGLPDGATYSLDKEEIPAGSSLGIHFDFTRVVNPGDTSIFIRYTVNDSDTLSMEPIPVHVVRNYYEELALVTPVAEHDFSTGPEYSWHSDKDALSYEIEVATNPSFEPASIVFAESDLQNTYVRGPLLDVNTLYYWHVRGINECGPGPWTPTTAFSTLASSCNSYEANIRDKVISSGKTKNYYIELDKSFIISDVNITNITLGSEFLDGIQIQLFAPDNQASVIVWKNSCSSSVSMNAGFDDEAQDVTRCSNLNKGIIMRPKYDDLSKLNGVNSKGKWTLRVSNKRGNRTAKLESWKMQFCGNISIEAPYMVRNDSLKMKPDQEGPVSGSLLLAEDKKDGPGYLTYTLIEVPKHGILVYNNQSLKAGMQFTQQDLWDNKVVYSNMTHARKDDFSFVVQDREGAWTGVHRFHISIDPNNPSIATKNPLSGITAFRIFPNPAHSGIQIVPFEKMKNAIVDVHLLSLSGKEMMVERGLEMSNDGIKIELSSYPSGVYALVIRTKEHVYMRKIIIE